MKNQPDTRSIQLTRKNQNKRSCNHKTFNLLFKITPEEITYRFKTLFNDREISVLAYNLETLLAEKLETVVSRGDQNTRSRDYYDIYILSKLYNQSLDRSHLRNALKATAKKRGSSQILSKYESIIETAKNSPVMLKQWENYQKDFEYASSINFPDTCDAVLCLMEAVSDI